MAGEATGPGVAEGLTLACGLCLAHGKICLAIFSCPNLSKPMSTVHVPSWGLPVVNGALSLMHIST